MRNELKRDRIDRTFKNVLSHNKVTGKDIEKNKKSL